MDETEYEQAERKLQAHLVYYHFRNRLAFLDAAYHPRLDYSEKLLDKAFDFLQEAMASDRDIETVESDFKAHMPELNDFSKEQYLNAHSHAEHASCPF